MKDCFPKVLTGGGSGTDGGMLPGGGAGQANDQTIIFPVTSKLANGRPMTPREEATERLMEKLFSTKGDITDVNIDTVLELLCDDLPHAIGLRWQDWRRACADRDRAAMGCIVLEALDRCADRYANTEHGQNLIDRYEDQIRENLE
jgi:hypothetical protein